MSGLDQNRDNSWPSCDRWDRRQERSSLLGRRTVLSPAEMPNNAQSRGNREVV
jgi:hypothetical protein